MSTIALEGIEIFAHHGCFEEEKIIGTRFRLDIYLEADTVDAETSDDLTKTVDYQAVFQLVKEEMKTRSDLIEHVARRILDRILAEFPPVESAKIKLYKLNPPVGGEVASVSITLSTKRGEDWRI
jgi:dihydroneopterin aldolase